MKQRRMKFKRCNNCGYMVPRAHFCDVCSASLKTSFFGPTTKAGLGTGLYSGILFAVYILYWKFKAGVFGAMPNLLTINYSNSTGTNQIIGQGISVNAGVGIVANIWGGLLPIYIEGIGNLTNFHLMFIVSLICTAAAIFALGRYVLVRL